MCSFFIHSFVHPFFDTPIYPFIFSSFIQTFNHSCIIWCFLSFVCSSVFLFICSLIRSLVRLLELCLRSFAQLFIPPSVIHPHTRSLVCPPVYLFVHSFLVYYFIVHFFFICSFVRSLIFLSLFLCLFLFRHVFVKLFISVCLLDRSATKLFSPFL